MNKTISFLVSNDYHNEELNNIILKNDSTINEEIIHYGLLIYNCVQNKKIDNYEKSQIQDIKNLLESEYKSNNESLNSENIILKNECKKFQDQINDLTQSIEVLSNEKYNLFSSFLEKGKQLAKDEYQSILNLHAEQRDKLEMEIKNKDQFITQLQQKIINCEQNREDANIKAINNIDNKYNNIDNKYNNIDNSINQLNQKFSDYFQKIFTSNTEKGEYGEEFVQNYLIDKFSGSSIIDTHKDTANGDLMFHFNTLKTLIEVKNVQQVKQTEIDKFYRDIQIRKDEINSALFISLNDTNLIKGQKIIHFEIKYNIPIFMISNAFNNPENIRLAIIITQYLINHNFIIDNKNKDNKEENKQIFQLLITAINEIFEYIQIQKASLANDTALLQKMQDSFKKRESHINNIDIVINGIFRQYPQLYICNTTKREIKETAPISEDTNNLLDNYEMKKIINSIIDHIKDNNLTSFNNTMINNKLLKNLLISDGNIRHVGGIKNIKIAYNLHTKQHENNKIDIPVNAPHPAIDH